MRIKPRRIDPKKPSPYAIVVPPWAKITHKEARTAILTWAATAPEFAGSPLKFIEEMETDIPKAGGNAFGANLTGKQAEALQTRFRFKARRGPGAAELFVSPDYDFQPVGSGDSFEEFNPEAVSSTSRRARSSPAPVQAVMTTPESCARDLMVPNEQAITQASTPVLYVVDTGVQPFVPAATPSGYDWHPEFKPLVTAGKLRFRQGRVATGVGLWPKSTAPAPWNSPLTPPPDPVLSFTSTNLKPCTAQAAPYDCDPYNDPMGHGTRIASTAIGASLGALSKFTVGGVPVDLDVESIRIYKTASTTPPTFVTSSASVYNGIIQAVQAHLARVTTANPSPKSVLVFASRTTAGFSANVEVALWWAWTKGMIVVVSGGNEPGTGNASQMHSPSAIWYTSAGVLPTTQPTSPSRFDWTYGNNPAAANRWPNPTLGGGTVPCPDRPYLIIAGGNAVQYSAGSSDYSAGNQGWRTTTGNYNGSSRGPDIDIVAPSILVPNVTPGTTTLGQATGTSFTTGYVAGVALAYAATQASGSGGTTWTVPDAFRSWLIPPGGPGVACALSAASGWNGTVRQSPYVASGSGYGGFVPQLQVTGSPP